MSIDLLTSCSPLLVSGDFEKRIGFVVIKGILQCSRQSYSLSLSRNLALCGLACENDYDMNRLCSPFHGIV